MDKTLVLDKPEQINAFALLSLRGRLKLEVAGMRCGGPSALSIVKRNYGIKARSAKEALIKFEEYLREREILE